MNKIYPFEGVPEMADEDRLTHYEELGVQKDDLNPRYAVKMFHAMGVMLFFWVVLMATVVATECSTRREVPCFIANVGVQWGSLVYGNGVVLLLSFGLYFKNGRRSRVPMVLAFLCYVISLVDVVVLYRVAPLDAVGLPSVSILWVWMIAVCVDVWKAVYGRVLTRGRRKKVPRALVFIACLYAACVVVVCVVRFTRQAQWWIIGSWCGVALATLAYVCVATIHLRKVKILLYNSASFVE